MTETPWLTAEEAIAYLRIGGLHPRKALFRLCRSKHLQYGGNGRNYLFKREWLDTFLMLNGSAGARQEANRKLNRRLAAV